MWNRESGWCAVGGVHCEVECSGVDQVFGWKCVSCVVLCGAGLGCAVFGCVVWAGRLRKYIPFEPGSVLPKISSRL